MLLKGAIKPVSPCKNQYLSIKEGWGQQTNSKLETSEQFHPIPAFQNGGTEFIKKCAPERRLHEQAGPKRRGLFLCSSKKGIKEICTVSVGRDTLRVPLSFFWSRSSSSNIYQNFKGTNFPLEKASDSCDNISGRHVTHVTDTRRVINEQRYNNFSSNSTGICNQFEKVYPSASLRISRLGDRFCRNGTISSSKKGGGDCSDVSKHNGRQFDLKGFGKVTGKIDFHNSSNFASETSDSFPATDTNTGPEKKHDLRIYDYFGYAGQRGAVIVDNQHEHLE